MRQRSGIRSALAVNAPGRNLEMASKRKPHAGTGTGNGAGYSFGMHIESIVVKKNLVAIRRKLKAG